MRILEKEEIRALRNTREGRDRIAVSLGLCGGLRSGEVFRLRWDDIDFAKGLLTVYQAKHNKKVLISLPMGLIDELRNYAANCTGDRLFEDQSTDYFTRYFQMLNRKFKRLLSGNVTFKTLRNTFATHLIKAGIPIQIVSNVLGHTNNTVTEKYARINHLRKLLEGLI